MAGRRVRWGVALGAAFVLMVAMSPSAGAATTARVSLDTGGRDPNGDSFDPSVSADGRHVAFWSRASDLVSGDGDGFGDVFVRDVTTGITTRASVDTNGGDPLEECVDPKISGNGRFVAFRSFASDLVPDDHNGQMDVFLRDMVAGTTQRVSVDMAGGDSDSYSYLGSVSPTGRYVAFYSNASDLVPEDGNGWLDVFVRDMVAGITTRVSVDTDGSDANGPSLHPSISATGRYMAFGSAASDLVPADGNAQYDVFVRDLVAGTTVRASVDAAGGDADDDSGDPSISANGRFVAFDSVASDLVPLDGNALLDVFVRDLAAGITTRVSVNPTGGDANADSWNPSMNATGRYVAYWSYASDLVDRDGNQSSDVFLWDMAGVTTTRVSVDTAGGDGNSASARPSISSDGRFVAFHSHASDLVPGDRNDLTDVFLARRT